jgi:hypothetical protein
MRSQANENHSTVGLPHSSGPKWTAQEGPTLVAAQCGGSLGCIARYAGSFATEVYNVSRLHAIGDWIFVEPADDLSQDCSSRSCEAWAAVRYAWKGLNATASSLHAGVIGSGNRSFLLVPEDPWSPVVMFAGNRSTFGSFQKFVAAVLGADFHVSPLINGVRVVRFTPPAGGKPCPSLCKTILFPWTQNKSAFTPPSIGGSPMVDQPTMAYNGPLLQSMLGTNTALTSSGSSGIRERYDFATDTITRLA